MYFAHCYATQTVSNRTRNARNRAPVPISNRDCRGRC